MSRVYEAVVAELQRRGVEAVFGLLGEDVVKLGAEVDQSAIDFYTVRHEGTAVAMADGYWRACGRMGVALISRGPGLTNALTAIATAVKAQSRVLVITGDSDPGIRGTVYSKWIDQTMLLAGLDAAFVTLDDPLTAASDFAAACDYAATRGAIVASFRGDTLNQLAGAEQGGWSAPEVHVPDAPDPDEITYVVDAVRETFQRPIILAGQGAVASGARARSYSPGTLVWSSPQYDVAGEGLLRRRDLRYRCVWSVRH